LADRLSIRWTLAEAVRVRSVVMVEAPADWMAFR